MSSNQSKVSTTTGGISSTTNTSTSANSTDDNNIKARPHFVSHWQLLEKRLGLPALFLAASTTIGLVSGFITGGVTAVMTNRIETPAARPHILKVTRLMGIAGLVHGIVGAGIIATRGHDDLKNRAVSGCAAGLSLGITQGSTGLACGMCLALAALSIAERSSSSILTSGYNPNNSKTISALDPVFKSDEKWIESWRQRIEQTKPQ